MTEGLLAPHTASPPYVVRAIQKVVQLQPHDVFYDLGCGAHAFPGGPERRPVPERMLPAQPATPSVRVLILLAEQLLQQQQARRQEQTVPQQQHQQQQTRKVQQPLAQQEQEQHQQQEVGHCCQLVQHPQAAQQSVQQQHQQQHDMDAIHLRGPSFIGIELDPQAAAAAAAAVRGLPGAIQGAVTIIQGDLLEVPLHNATVVYAYLLPKGLLQLAPKLLQELRQGSFVMTYVFQIHGWDDMLQCCVPVTSGDAKKPDVSGVSKLYVYKV